MNTEEDLSEEAYKWITPIMVRGNKAVGEAAAAVVEGCNKSAAIITALRAELTNEEQVIYHCEDFDVQCNMSGLRNFFSDSISLTYYEVLAALGVIGAEDMIEDLRRCKHVIFGDQEVPVHDEALLDDLAIPEDPDREQEIDSQIDEINHTYERREGFKKHLYQYVLSCADKGLLKNPIG
jgi:hypothetical protein